MARDGKGHGFNKMAAKNDDIMQRPNFKTKTMYVEVILFKVLQTYLKFCFKYIYS